MKILLLFVFLCLLISRVDAAVTFDPGAVAISTADGSSSPTVNVTVGAGCTNRAIIAIVAWYEGGAAPGSVSSMTIGGSAATFIGGVSPSAGAESRRIEMWYRVGVSTGSNTVTATMSESMYKISIAALSYCGVHQSVPLGTPATADTASPTAATVDVSSGATELVVDAAMTIGHESFTATAGQTERLNDATAAGFFYVGSSEKTGAGTTTMSWDLSGADANGIIAVPLKPVAATAVRRHRVVTFQ